MFTFQLQRYLFMHWLNPPNPTWNWRRHIQPLQFQNQASNSKHLQLANQLHQHNLGKCKLGCYSRYIFFHNETYMNTIYVYTIYVYHTYQILWFLTILTYFPYESSVETHLRLERRKNVSEWRLLTFVGCIQSSIPPPLQECTELWLNILKWFFHFIMGHPIHHISYI